MKNPIHDATDCPICEPICKPLSQILRKATHGSRPKALLPERLTWLSNSWLLEHLTGATKRLACIKSPACLATRQNRRGKQNETGKYKWQASHGRFPQGWDVEGAGSWKNFGFVQSPELLSLPALARYF